MRAQVFILHQVPQIPWRDLTGEQDKTPLLWADVLEESNRRYVLEDCWRVNAMKEM